MSLSLEEFHFLLYSSWCGELSELCRQAAVELAEGRWEEAAWRARLLLDAVWERLNTGHWKDVKPRWRLHHSLASLLCAASTLRLRLADLGSPLPAASHESLLAALKDLDYGLLMGDVRLDAALADLADRVHKRLPKCELGTSQASEERERGLGSSEPKSSSQGPQPQSSASEPSCSTSASTSSPATMLNQPSPPQAPSPKRPRLLPSIAPSSAIPRLAGGSLEAFLTAHLLPQRPVVLTGLLEGWPALAKWSEGHLLEVAGWRHVPVEIGSRYDADGWGQQIMPLRDFIRRFVLSESQEKGYLAQHELFSQIPSLAGDLAVPDECHLLEDAEDTPVSVNAWFGPAGTVSPLHQDPRNNLLAQVRGSKYVRLHDVADSASVYPHPDGMLKNTSQADMEAVDEERFPLLGTIPKWECVLEAGDVLFIPRQWWHYLRSLSPSFSVSFWFGPPAE